MHWQSNNTINECLIIPLDIHWWKAKKDGKAWLVRDIFLTLNSVHLSLLQSFPQHLLFHHHTLFTVLPQSHHLAQFSFHISKGDGDIPVGVDRNVGMMCVHMWLCWSVWECFMTLSSANEREEVSSVINSHRQSCPICVSRHRFALSHTQLPSLSHFSQPPSFAPCALPPRPLLVCLCISDNSLAPTASLHISLKFTPSVYGSILIPIQTRLHMWLKSKPVNA